MATKTEAILDPITGKYNTKVTTVPDELPTGPIYDTSTGKFTPIVTDTTNPMVRNQITGGLEDNPNYKKDTVGSTYSGLLKPAFSGSDFNEDPAITRANAERAKDLEKGAYAQVDEAAIRAQTLANYQAEIDSTNALFAKKLSDAKVSGQNRIGQVGATNARYGLFGSNVGDAGFNNIEKGNQNIYDTIEAEKQAKLAEIGNTIRTVSKIDYEAKKAAKAADLDSYIKYLNEAGTRKITKAQKIAQAIIDASTDPDKLSKQDILELENAGLTIDEVRREYGPMKKAKDAADTKLKLDQAKEQQAIDYQKAQTDAIAKKFEEDKRQFGLTYAQNAEKIAIDRMKAEQDRITSNAKNNIGADGKPMKSPLKDVASRYANDLLNKFNKELGTSAIGKYKTLTEYTTGMFSGTDRENFVKTFDALKAALSLDNVKYLKGQGSVSDAERRLISDVSLLDRGMTVEEFGKKLNDIINSVNGLETGSVANNQSGNLVAPDGQEVIITD